MLRRGSTGGGAEARALGGAVDTLEAVSATAVALGHGAATFCLPGMTALAGLADAAARGVRGDSVDGEGVGRRGAVAIHACGG